MQFSAQFINRALLAVCLSLLVACSTTPQIGRLPLIGSVKDRIANIVLPIQLPVRTGIKGVDIERFNACMAPLSAKFKPGFISLINSIKNQTSGADEQLFGKINEIGDENLLISDWDLHPVIDHLFNSILNGISTDKVFVNPGKLAEINNKVIDHFKSNQQVLETESKEATLRAKEYLTAYFTKGSERTVTQALQNKQLTEQIAAVLKRKVDDPGLTKALELINDQLTKASAKITHLDTGFVAGDGARFSFPGNQDDDRHTAIDHSQISADIVRILLEALRDTYAPLPAFDASTATQTKTVNKLDRYKFAFDNADTANITWHIDRHDPQKIENLILTRDQFQLIGAHARQAEAFVASRIGKVIRGGSWGALNNESVARLVETVAGVVARHATERAEWCMYAQVSSQQ